ncbi:MAG: S-methyl-5-thioribose-1-phosphate isomerase [Deltaproteobacteria bacterium RIFOXYA12_FULL_61_11]|nr:MAG: S-methyl-5-thioribose-1-phosphate isomerase [Deltaproteobacteria bacterium RIFOXYA12_FULL_61_11]
MSSYYTIRWAGDHVSMIDQRRLPTEELYLRHDTWQEVAHSIETMVIRGAPAIGIAAAMGIALAAVSSRATTLPALRAELDEAGRGLLATRPTAVNLAWALRRMAAVAERGDSVEALTRALVDEAQAVYNEDVAINRALGRHGGALIDDGDGVMTICNAGSLAVSEYGTALGVIRAAVEAGKRLRVFAPETRPFLQGARLTSWELHREGIPVTLITDGMAATVMARGLVRLIVVGADRVAINGDAANKIGTYGLAVLAKYHHLPFYVAAPLSTVDPATSTGADIPIEYRHPDEVRGFRGERTAPAEVEVFNPAFDVTPSELIAGIITERGVARAPFEPALLAMLGKVGTAGR